MAPSVDIAMSTFDSSDRYSVSLRQTGTSFAAPRVSSLVAMMYQQDQRLRSWPVAVRAVLMASAVNRLQNRDGDIPEFGPQKIGGLYGLDKQIGVGGVNGQGASEIIAGDRFTDKGFFHLFQGLPASWIPDGANGAYKLNTDSVIIETARQRARVVLTWNGDADCWFCSSAPTFNAIQSDLDLEVLDGNSAPLVNAAGKKIGLSLSFDNNYEVIDIPTAGLVQPLRVRVKSFGPTIRTEPFAVAVFYYDGASAESPP